MIAPHLRIVHSLGNKKKTPPDMVKAIHCLLSPRAPEVLAARSRDVVNRRSMVIRVMRITMLFYFNLLDKLPALEIEKHLDLTPLPQGLVPFVVKRISSTMEKEIMETPSLSKTCENLLSGNLRTLVRHRNPPKKYNTTSLWCCTYLLRLVSGQWSPPLSFYFNLKTTVCHSPWH
jgi:hypothetical protein